MWLSHAQEELQFLVWVGSGRNQTDKAKGLPLLEEEDDCQAPPESSLGRHGVTHGGKHHQSGEAVPSENIPYRLIKQCSEYIYIDCCHSWHSEAERTGGSEISR